MKTLFTILILFFSIASYSQDDDEFESNQYPSADKSGYYQQNRSESEYRIIAVIVCALSIGGFLYSKERASHYESLIKSGSPKVQFESKRINHNRATLGYALVFTVAIIIWFFNEGPAPVLGWLKIYGMKTFLIVAGFFAAIIICGSVWLVYLRIASLLKRKKRRRAKEATNDFSPGGKDWKYKPGKPKLV